MTGLGKSISVGCCCGGFTNEACCAVYFYPFEPELLGQWWRSLYWGYDCETGDWFVHARFDPPSGAGADPRGRIYCDINTLSDCGSEAALTQCTESTDNSILPGEEFVITGTSTPPVCPHCVAQGCDGSALSWNITFGNTFAPNNLGFQFRGGRCDIPTNGLELCRYECPGVTCCEEAVVIPDTIQMSPVGQMFPFNNSSLFPIRLPLLRTAGGGDSWYGEREGMIVTGSECLPAEGVYVELCPGDTARHSCSVRCGGDGVWEVLYSLWKTSGASGLAAEVTDEVIAADICSPNTSWSGRPRAEPWAAWRFLMQW